MIDRTEIDRVLASFTSAPVAFEALWDGDSNGWFIQLSAVLPDGKSYYLGTISGGGDIRLFNGQVPPWPEAEYAARLGRELAQQYQAEFYFPSPDHPEDGCPCWHDREKGIACPRCRIPLMPGRSSPNSDLCHSCFADEATEKREAQWTPEERSGPRCTICGDPAAHELESRRLCNACHEKYEIYHCSRCEGSVMILKSVGHSELCSICESRLLVESLTPTQQNKILEAMSIGTLQGISVVRELIDCSLNDAETVLYVMRNP